ncbi:hypothetical protein QA601_18880, partial [Chitinispirillales bacterium ANBcel5]|nr:hypothetical protein [Chitinispirillales bacterium ANBcel5]
WLSADPAGPVDGWNLYEYCRSRPTALNDPDGRRTSFPEYSESSAREMAKEGYTWNEDRWEQKSTPDTVSVETTETGKIDYDFRDLENNTETELIEFPEFEITSGNVFASDKGNKSTEDKINWFSSGKIGGDFYLKKIEGKDNDLYNQENYLKLFGAGGYLTNDISYGDFKADAQASIIDMSGEIGLTDKESNYGLTIKGGVEYLSAKAGAGMDNFALYANADAKLMEYKVSFNIKIAGHKIGVDASLIIGGVGIGGKLGPKTGFKLAAGVGGSLFLGYGGRNRR